MPEESQKKRVLGRDEPGVFDHNVETLGSFKAYGGGLNQFSGPATFEKWIEIPHRSTDPTAWGTNERGRVFFHTTANLFKFWDGSQFLGLVAGPVIGFTEGAIPFGGAGGGFCDEDPTKLYWTNATDIFNVVGTSNLDGAVVINESNADKDFRVEGSGATYTHLFFTDASANKVGINESSPQKLLHITGTKLASANYHTYSGLIVENDGNTTINIVSDNDATGYLAFTATTGDGIGRIEYDHVNDQFEWYVNSNAAGLWDSVGLCINQTITSATNPLTVWAYGTEAGYGTYGGVVARFREDTNKHTTIAIDARTTYDPVLAFSANGFCQWDVRFDNDASDVFQIRYQGGNGGFANLTVLEIAVGGAVTIPGTLTLASGTSINEFSVDGAMVGNSDNALPTEKAVVSYIKSFHELTNEPTGFENRTDSTLAWGGTRTLTISPSNGSFDFYQEGTEYTKSSPENIQIADTSGAHYIYYDAGTLTVSVNPSNATLGTIYETKPLVAVIYWNATDGATYILGDERHGLQMDGVTHRLMHNTEGALWGSGLTLSGYTLNTGSDAALTFEVTDGEFFDQDITHSITDGTAANQYEQQLSSGDAVVPVLYRDDTDGTWKEDAASTLPYKVAGTGRLAYNNDDGDGTFSQIEVDDNEFMSVTLVATNDWLYPIKMIQGQNEYTDKKTAVEEALSEILSFGDLPTPEMTFLYRLVMQTKDTFGGTKKAKIVDVTDLRGSLVTGSTAVAVDHGVLSGLADDDHSQYLLIDGTRAMTGALTLGGDLQLGGNSIDFPTTPNISDCLDEDNMASNSATMLATQQSIKAYVDASGGANHAILDGSVHTDSVADAVTRGSIIYGNATPKWDELVIGAANTFLGSDGTDLSYRTATQVMASLSGAAGAAFAWNSQNLTGIGTLNAGSNLLSVGEVAGLVGVGTNAPDDELELRGDSAIVAAPIAFRLRNIETGANSRVAQKWYIGTTLNLDLVVAPAFAQFRFYPNSGILYFSSADDIIFRANYLNAGGGTVSFRYDASNSGLQIHSDGKVTLNNIPSTDAGDYDLRYDAADGVVYNTSDIRQKKNIKSLDYGLAEILQLQPKSYTYYVGLAGETVDDKTGKVTKKKIEITNKSKESFGLIAQEVYDIIPEVVYKPEDEKTAFWGLRENKLIPILINAIKELNTKIATLEANP